MKKIQLTQNKVALVDDEDFDRVNQFKWCAHKRSCGKFEAFRNAGQRKIQHMHRFIVTAPFGLVVDHINGDALDNRKANLRVCTTSQNLRNRPMQKNNTTGYKGVKWDRNLKRYRADVTVNKRGHFLGGFHDPREAAKAYNEGAMKYHGEYANLNKI